MKKSSTSSSSTRKPCVATHDALKGLQPHYISKDGHCLFRAVGFISKRTVSNLRQQVARYMEEHADEYHRYRPGTVRQFKSYIKVICNENAWGGEIEIEILRRVLNRPIIVVQHNYNPRIPDNIDFNEEDEPVFIYFHRNHYSALTVKRGFEAKDILDHIQNAIKRDEIVTLQDTIPDKSTLTLPEIDDNICDVRDIFHRYKIFLPPNVVMPQTVMEVLKLATRSSAIIDKGAQSLLSLLCGDAYSHDETVTTTTDVTTTNENLESKQQVPLPRATVMSFDDTVHLLKQRSCRVQEETDLTELAWLLNHSLLASVFAGAYLVRHQSITVREYTNVLNQQLVQQTHDLQNKTSSPPVEADLATLSISSSAINKTNHIAWTLLSHCAYLDGQKIPRSILIHILNLQPDAMPSMLDKCLHELVHYDLISIDNNDHAISIHPTVQALVRSYDTRQVKIKRLIDVSTALNNDHLQDSQQAVIMIPHLQTIITHIKDLPIEKRCSFDDINEIKLLKTLKLDTLLQTLVRLGNMHEEIKAYNKARSLYEQALVMAIALRGEQAASVAALMNNIGVVCNQLHQYRQAKIYFEQALMIKIAKYGEQHCQVATAMYNLGKVYTRFKNTSDKGLSMLLKALEIFQKTHGPDHPNTVKVRKFIAILPQLNTSDTAKTTSLSYHGHSLVNKVSASIRRFRKQPLKPVQGDKSRKSALRNSNPPNTTLESPKHQP